MIYIQWAFVITYLVTVSAAMYHGFRMAKAWEGECDDISAQVR